MIGRRASFAGACAVLALAIGCAGVSRMAGTPRPSAEVTKVDVFAGGQDGYHTYRIPALVTTGSGTLLAFVEGRKDGRADHGDIDLLLKRSHDGGRTWSAQAIVHEEGGSEKITIGNPSPVVDRDTGALWLPFTRDNRDVFVTHSTDGGLTWAAPVDITADVKRPGWGWYATGPGVGIQLRHGPHRGRLIVPADHRERIDERWVKHSHVFFSDDHGRSWRLGGTVAPHTDECQVAELSDGTLVINMRNYWGLDGGQPEKGARRALAWSRDGGETWSPPAFDPTLVEPVCQASLLRYRPGTRGDRRLLFANPATPDRRVRLTVRVSPDDGRTWPLSRVLEDGPSAYSSIAVLPDGSVGVLYERGAEHPYERITFARFAIAWLAGPQVGVEP